MRDNYIDFVKGMLIWSVVYGHTVDALLYGTQHPSVWLHVFVRTFDLPFFMVLSGYFLKRSLEKRGVLNVAINRVTMIFVPIAIWTILRGHLNVFCGTYYFLWAVLASGMICLVGHSVSQLLTGKIGLCVEMLLYIGVTVIMHLINVPWNLFYLFPFFAVGYFIQDVRFCLTKRKWMIAAIAMAGMLCFWSPVYTPWKIGALAWKLDSMAFCIYVYRFTLAIFGVYVMSKLFEIIRTSTGSDSFFVKVITKAGSETLAIYILQTILVERIVRRSCGLFWGELQVVPSQHVVNLIGYVLALVFSFAFIIAILYFVGKVKSYKMLSYAFGFKLRG